MNAIETKGLYKEYPGFTLDHIDLTLPQGCILGLVGENGAGKSTTIRLILDMLKKDAGTVTIFGKNADNRDALLMNDIGVVLDEVGLPVMMNAMQISKIMKDAFRNWDQKKYEEYCSGFNVDMSKKFDELSNGTKMKLGLAIAFSHDAKLLILDEATNGLDPVVRDEVNDILMEFTRDENHSVLISSHIVTDLEKLCDYIAFLHKGKLVLCEEKDVLADEYCIVRGTKEELSVFEMKDVLHMQDTPYSSEAVVKKNAVPAGMNTSQISIEELFVMMSKEMKRS